MLKKVRLKSIADLFVTGYWKPYVYYDYGLKQGLINIDGVIIPEEHVEYLGTLVVVQTNEAVFEFAGAIYPNDLIYEENFFEDIFVEQAENKIRKELKLTESVNDDSDTRAIVVDYEDNDDIEEYYEEY